MKFKISHQDRTDVYSIPLYVEITQEDSNGERVTIYIANENAERFCAMVMDCARGMQNGEVGK